MTHVMTIGSATVEMSLFKETQKLALQCLREQDALKAQSKDIGADFKAHVDTLSKTTGLNKKELANFFKARYQETKPKDDESLVGTQAVIASAELFIALNDALEG